MAASVIRQNQGLVVQMRSLDYHFGYVPPCRGATATRTTLCLAQARVRRVSPRCIDVKGAVADSGEATGLVHDGIGNYAKCYCRSNFLGLYWGVDLRPNFKEWCRGRKKEKKQTFEQTWKCRTEIFYWFSLGLLLSVQLRGPKIMVQTGLNR